MSDSKELLLKLYKECSHPDRAKIETLPKAGMNLEFYSHAYVTGDLITHDPEWSFAITHIVERNNQLEVLGTLTVHGATRACVGYASAKKEDPAKEAISDMIKNGAMRFGVALDLWAKGDIENGKDLQLVAAKTASPPTSQVTVKSFEIKKLIDSLTADQKATLKAWMVEALPGKKVATMDQPELLRCKEQIVKIRETPDMIAEAFPGAEVV